MTTTHSEAVLELSAIAFEEIRHKLTKAGYLHLIHDDIEGGWISLNGIRVQSEIDCAESKKLTMGQRAEAKWSADIERIEDHILASKDEYARFKWQQLVSQEIGMYIRISEAVEPRQFDSLCSDRGFDQPMKDYLKEMLIFLGLGWQLAEVPIEDGAFQITVNGSMVAVKTLKPSANEVIRACGPGYSEAQYYRVIETLLDRTNLESSTQKTYSGNMVIDYKAQANYIVLRRDQPLPPHLQLKPTAITSEPLTEIDIGVASTIAMLNCPFCDSHSLDLRVRDSGLEISFGIFCTRQTPNKQHYKNYPDGKVKVMASGQIINMVIDDLVTPVLRSIEASHA